MPLHADEVPVTEAHARRLVDAQFPQWAHLPLTPAGHGTDNRTLRLGEDLLIRLPRTPATAADVAKEQHWLPRLRPHLPLDVPAPVALGAPDASYPFPWSVYRWIEGDPLDPDAVSDPERLGRDLARFVRALHGTDLMGAQREGPLRNYRGGRLGELDRPVRDNLMAGMALAPDLDLLRLERMWAQALDLREPATPHTWMHVDLKPSNLLVRNGRLVG